MQLNDKELQALKTNLHLLSVDEQEETLVLLEELERRNTIELAKTSFLLYVRYIWPSFIEGAHYNIMARKFEEIERGTLKRLIINMPPRHGKSEMSSWLLPSWFIGKNPHKKIIQASHTANLAVGFGRKARNTIDSAEFKEIFPDSKLAADAKAAGSWNTNHGGVYKAIGVGGAVAGKGADLLIIDDPHSERDAISGNPDVFDAAYEWYQTGPLQRLQPGGAIIVVMTRWSTRDLVGRLLDKSAKDPGSGEWEVIEFPAILPSGRSLWPAYWKIEELEQKRADMDARFWNAQYQQQPTSDGAALIKRDWWKRWDKDDPPECEYILQSWDTAFEKNTRADYSACTTWGIFNKKIKTDDGEEREVAHLILLDAFKERMEFPELKKMALELYKEWKPDTCIIEKKASGAPLIYEMRQIGVPVSEFVPSKGQDKTARVNAVSDIFASGLVYAPYARWADDVIEECAAFPSAMHDDLVDSTTQALLRFRKGGFIRIISDYEDEEDEEMDARRAIPKKFY